MSVARPLGTLDLDVGEPAEPRGEVPVALAEQLHRGWDEHQAYDGGVEQQGDRHAESHLLEHDQVAAREAPKTASITISTGSVVSPGNSAFKAS